MKPWELVDTAAVPGGGTLRLLRRDAEFSMRLDGTELMGSRVRGSEEALAQLGCAELGDTARPRLLIGGLGMGFTLRAALDRLGPEAEVVVAELVPAVVAWNRGPMAALAGHALADPRVDVREADVGRLIRSGRAGYDAILLDVDNGPAGLTRDANDGLYGAQGLAQGWAALRPGGVFCVWSAAPDPAFTRRLRRAGFLAQERTVRAHASRGARHTIWLARRPGGPASGPG